MNKALFIVGPTASGKTDLAFMLAPKFNGILINADSRQVYKKLNIIAGKDILKGSKFVKEKVDLTDFNFGYHKVNNQKIYLLDLVDPTYSFNVYDFIKVAIPTVNYVSSKEKLPIVVGGTGFYIKALIDGIETINIPPDEKLRKELEDLNPDSLFDILKKENPRRAEKMNKSDRRNKRRLIRAIEIERSSFQPSEGQKLKIHKLEDYDILTIGLKVERYEIKKRIDGRIEKRLKQGAINEAKKMFKNYKNLSLQVKTSNGYRQLFEHLKGKINLQTAIEEWRKAEYESAKKQITFFRKDKRIIWFDVCKKGFERKIERVIKQWYN